MRRVDDGGKEYYRGSGRGLDSSALADFRQFLLDSGLMDYAEGHASAFGVSLLTSNLSALNAYANTQLANVNFNEGVYEVDFIENASSPIEELTNEIGHAEMVWGKAVEEPWIVIEGLMPRPEQLQLMGANKDTVKWLHNGIWFVKFKDSDFIEVLKNLQGGQSITVLGRANVNRYMGKETLQFFITDYNVNDAIFDF